MAKQKKPTYHKPIPISEKIRLWANETLEAIQSCFQWNKDTKMKANHNS